MMKQNVLLLACALLLPVIPSAATKTGGAIENAVLMQALDVCAASVETRSPPNPGEGWILTQPYIRDDSTGIDTGIMTWVREDRTMAMATLVNFDEVNVRGLWKCDLVPAPGSGRVETPLDEWVENARSSRGYVDVPDPRRGQGDESWITLTQCGADGLHVVVKILKGDPTSPFFGNRDWKALFSLARGFERKIEDPCRAR